MEARKEWRAMAEKQEGCAASAIASFFESSEIMQLNRYEENGSGDGEKLDGRDAASPTRLQNLPRTDTIANNKPGSAPKSTVVAPETMPTGSTVAGVPQPSIPEPNAETFSSPGMQQAWATNLQVNIAQMLM